MMIRCIPVNCTTRLVPGLCNWVKAHDARAAASMSRGAASSPEGTCRAHSTTPRFSRGPAAPQQAAPLRATHDRRAAAATDCGSRAAVVPCRALSGGKLRVSYEAGPACRAAGRVGGGRPPLGRHAARPARPCANRQPPLGRHATTASVAVFVAGFWRLPSRQPRSSHVAAPRGPRVASRALKALRSLESPCAAVLHRVGASSLAASHRLVAVGSCSRCLLGPVQ